MEGLPRVCGLFGLENFTEFPSRFAVTKSGSMTDMLFCSYIKDIIVLLYPNVGKEWKYVADGEVLEGPVIIKTDAGPGRLCANFANVKFRRDLGRMGVDIVLSLPNATSVDAELDDMFKLFKPACRERTQLLYTNKVYERMLTICRNNEAGEGQRLVSVKPVKISQEDLSMIVNGLEEDAEQNRSFNHFFTKIEYIKSLE